MSERKFTPRNEEDVEMPKLVLVVAFYFALSWVIVPMALGLDKVANVGLVFSIPFMVLIPYYIFGGCVATKYRMFIERRKN